MNVYLDNAATTRLSDDHIEYLTGIMKDCFGNPNSNHSVGDKARVVVEEARDAVAKFINADSENIIFTPSGSASNTLGIKGYNDSCGGRHICIIYSPIAHKSIIKYMESHETEAYPKKLRIDDNGLINIDYLESQLKVCNRFHYQPFVVIDYANSEIGVIQDVKRIISLTHKYGGIVYLDCTASIPSIKLDVKELDVDIVGFSGHKLGALKGIGVLYKKEDIKLKPLVYGAQEFGLVGGTSNVLSIASLGYAISNYNYSTHSNCTKRDHLLHYIFEMIDGCRLVGDINNRLSTNLNMMFDGIDSSRLIQLLDDNGIQVSSGSACNSGTSLPSYVLKAVGLSDEDAKHCIRISLSGNETVEELDYFVNILIYCVNVIRNGVV